MNSTYKKKPQQIIESNQYIAEALFKSLINDDDKIVVRLIRVEEVRLVINNMGGKHMLNIHKTCLVNAIEDSFKIKND